MSHQGDNIVLYLLLGIIILLFVKRWVSLRTVINWSKKPTKKDAYTARGEVPDLLREAGFDVVTGKEKIELSISVDEENYESRLYIDYIVKSGESLYLVIVAKDRKLIRMYGPSLRDAFLSYYLLYRPEAILYVNREKGSIKVIDFDVPDFKVQSREWLSPVYTLAFGVGVGVILTWLMFK